MHNQTRGPMPPVVHLTEHVTPCGGVDRGGGYRLPASLLPSPTIYLSLSTPVSKLLPPCLAAPTTCPPAPVLAVRPLLV